MSTRIDLTPEKLEDYAKKLLYSDEKTERRAARSCFLKETSNCRKFPHPPEKGVPLWVKLRGWIKSTINKDNFPFEVRPLKVTNEVKPIRTYPFQALSQACKEPAFVAAMAFGINKNGGNVERFIRQIKLLNEEGFGTTAEASCKEAKKSLKVVVGANFAASLDSRVNRMSKRKIQLLARIRDENTAIVGFVWCPTMVYKKDSPLDKEKRESFHVVKRFVRLIRDMNDELALKIARGIAFDLWKAGSVPMTRVRQTILDDGAIESAVSLLRKKSPDRQVFYFSCDSDAISLRDSTRGIFSEYRDLAERNPKGIVFSTGYIIRDPKNDIVEVASMTDRIVRYALGPTAYFPEPNMCVRLKMDLSEGIGFSYIVPSKAAASLGMESDRLIKSLGLNQIDSAEKVVFGRWAPIVTEGRRVKIHESLEGKLTPKDYADPENLKKMQDFLQACYHPLKFAHTVQRSLPKGMGTGKIAGVIQTLFRCYNPIDFASKIGVENDWHKHFYDFHCKLIRLRMVKKKDRTNEIERATKYPSVEKSLVDLYQSEIKPYLTASLNTLDETDKTLRETYEMDKNIRLFIHKKSQDASLALFAALEHKIIDRRFVMPML